MGGLEQASPTNTIFHSITKKAETYCQVSTQSKISSFKNPHIKIIDLNVIVVPFQV
jgi:hypothetical protein